MGHELMKASALVLCGCVCPLVVVPTSAKALEFNGGVSVGGIQVGIEPRLAVSPFAGWLWRSEGDFRLEVHNMLSIVPGAGVGVYDRTAVTLGYATKTSTVSLGPSLAIYSSAMTTAQKGTGTAGASAPKSLGDLKECDKRCK
jgi:hypothetical protein